MKNHPAISDILKAADEKHRREMKNRYYQLTFENVTGKLQFPYTQKGLLQAWKFFKTAADTVGRVKLEIITDSEK